MTEEEWLRSEEPEAMYGHIRQTTTVRRLRLYHVAKARQMSHLLRDGRSLRSVEAGESFAEDGTDPAGLELAHREACQAASMQTGVPRMTDSDVDAAVAAWVAAMAAQPELRDEWTATRILTLVPPSVLGGLLRCIVGNPFRPLVADPRWFTADAVALARAAYDGRAWETLPVLADALQDAGCDDADMLGHLRGPGPHARGCWVVDLVLGKA